MEEELHEPTCHLRFRVETEYDERGDDCFIRSKRILQQLWRSQYHGVEDEWRDVPTDKDG